MASIARREKSRFWTACYTDRDGRQLKRSTKTTDRNQALRIAIELERAETQIRDGAATVTQFRKIISDVSEKITGESLAVPSVKDYLAGWLVGIGARNRPSTLTRYANTVALFLEQLAGKADKPVTAVTPPGH